MWYIRYTTGPRTNTPAKAAKVGAESIRAHFKNIDTDGASMGRSVADSIGHIGWMSAMAYNPTPVTDYEPVEAKPEAPIVCVWDYLKAAEKARVVELVGSPE